MDKQIDELVLLLLYLTSWQEEDLPEGFKKSWKGYPFSSLNTLTEQDLLRDSRRSKSVYLTPAAIEQAKQLADKYGIERD